MTLLFVHFSVVLGAQADKSKYAEEGVELTKTTYFVKRQMHREISWSYENAVDVLTNFCFLLNLYQKLVIVKKNQ